MRIRKKGEAEGGRGGRKELRRMYVELSSARDSHSHASGLEWGL